MSSTIWTPTEVASNRFRLERELWRATEAQHVVSTLPLVDTLDEQQEIERLLEQSKPPVPERAQGLHYLLFTPFRYPSPHGSRFRGPFEAGVFYGTEQIRTACAELGFWRWCVLRDSPALDRIDAKPHTIFRSRVACTAVDLQRPPFDRDSSSWKNADDYSACQAFSRIVRAAAVDAIAYMSVRDPQAGTCVAVMTPDAFASRDVEACTWLLTVTRSKVFWHRDSPVEQQTFEFDMAQWTASGSPLSHMQ